MKEIKFRIWDALRNEMLGPWDMQELTRKGLRLPTKNHLLMQYTGLKDRNGKEIYEGDILEGMGAVEWVNKDARFGINVLGELKEVEFWELKSKDLEVIGNIYENPELLK